MKRKLYVDMDGTIAEYRIGCDSMIFNKNYFYSLKKIGNVIDALMELENEGYEVYILTALIDSPYIEEEKHKWLDEHYCIDMNKRIFTKKGKAIYAKDNVLLDDYNKNLNAWNEAGGIAIKALNGINSKESYNGSSISIFDSKENIKNILKSFL